MAVWKRYSLLWKVFGVDLMLHRRKLRIRNKLKVILRNRKIDPKKIKYSVIKGETDREAESGWICAGRQIKRSLEDYPYGIVDQLPGGMMGDYGVLQYYISRQEVNPNDRHLVKEARSAGAPKEIINKLKELKGNIMNISREVAMDRQKKGIGLQLLYKAEKLGRKKKAGIIYAETSNAFAVKTYKKAGWEKLWVDNEYGLEYWGKFLE